MRAKEPKLYTPWLIISYKQTVLVGEPAMASIWAGLEPDDWHNPGRSSIQSCHKAVIFTCKGLLGYSFGQLKQNLDVHRKYRNYPHLLYPLRKRLLHH